MHGRPRPARGPERLLCHRVQRQALASQPRRGRLPQQQLLVFGRPWHPGRCLDDVRQRKRRPRTPKGGPLPPLAQAGELYVQPLRCRELVEALGVCLARGQPGPVANSARGPGRADLLPVRADLVGPDGHVREFEQVRRRGMVSLFLRFPGQQAEGEVVLSKVSNFQ